MSFLPQMIFLERSIFLIGMMGSGKSTVGPILAKRLNMPYVDIDGQIEKENGMSIPKIFAEFGEKKFRDLESTRLRKIALEDRGVFSTGGGIVLRKENREIMRAKGIVILLAADPKSLAKRIRSVSSRPLLPRENHLENELDAIWRNRKLDYKSSAHMVIDTDDLSPDETVALILDHLKETHEEDYC